MKIMTARMHGWMYGYMRMHKPFRDKTSKLALVVNFREQTRIHLNNIFITTHSKNISRKNSSLKPAAGNVKLSLNVRFFC